MALGPQLQRLLVCAGNEFYRSCESLNDLVPEILVHCPLLAQLAVGHLGSGYLAAVGINVSWYMLHGCGMH
jgi:hypothetical protein